MLTADELVDLMAQRHYDQANPLTRFFINRERRKWGQAPLRVSTPEQLRQSYRRG